jgi:hypothetical protein
MPILILLQWFACTFWTVLETIANPAARTDAADKTNAIRIVTFCNNKLKKI